MARHQLSACHVCRWRKHFHMPAHNAASCHQTYDEQQSGPCSSSQETYSTAYVEHVPCRRVRGHQAAAATQVGGLPIECGMHTVARLVLVNARLKANMLNASCVGWRGRSAYKQPQPGSAWPLLYMLPAVRNCGQCRHTGWSRHSSNIHAPGSSNCQCKCSY